MAEDSKTKITIYGSQAPTQETINKYPYGYQSVAVTVQKGSLSDQKLLDSMGAATEKSAQDKANAVLKTNPGYLESAQTTFTQVDPEYVTATTNLSFYTSNPTTAKLNTPTPGSVKETDTALRPVERDPRAPSGGTGTNREAVNPETGPVTTTPSNSADNKVSDDAGKTDNAGSSGGTSTGVGSGPSSTTVAGNESGSSTANNVTPIESTGPQKTNYNNKRRDNPLSMFSSSSYVLSLYAIPPEALNNFNNTGKWDLSKLILLIQNGGINSKIDAPRSKYFDYDFTIDDLEINSVISTKDTGYASNSISFKFKVYEPYSITFIDRLARVQYELSQQTSAFIDQEVKALQMPLLLTVKFYGYDAKGNPVYSGPSDAGDAKFVTNAYFRSFPIYVSKCTFKLDNKTTVYDVTAVAQNHFVAFGSMRGALDGNLNVSADTVDDAIKQVIANLNAKQKELSTGDNKKQDEPDEFKYEIIDPIISDAFITDQGNVKSKTGMLPVKSSLESNIKNSTKTTGVNQAKRLIEFASGTPILKIIDQIVSQSTYVGDALAVIDKEELPANEQDKDSTNNPNPKQLTWYNVTPQVSINPKFDKKRNQYPMIITYVIQKYAVPYVRSLVTSNKFNYPGPSKRYQYFYTGQNTEVLQYEQQYNLAYYLAMAATSDGQINGSAQGTVSNPKATTGGSAVGKESSRNEIVGSVTSWLYSPGDQIKAQIKILGDPDYLMTWISNPKSGSTDDNYIINPNTGQCFIEIEFKKVEDYNTASKNGTLVTTNDGLLTPNGNIKFWNYPKELTRVSQNTMIYMVTQVLSKFSRGVFTQDLKTILPNFPLPENEPNPYQKSDTTRKNPVENQSAAETARLARQTQTASGTPVVFTPITNIAGKINLAPANPDDPGQEKIIQNPPTNSEGRPRPIDISKIDPKTLLPKRVR